MGATVTELIDALRVLLRDHADMPVCLAHPRFGIEELTFVELRSERGEMVDLYSGTMEPAVDAAHLARALGQIAARGGKNFELSIFHPAHGAEPLLEITTDGDSLILKTEYSDREYRGSSRTE